MNSRPPDEVTGECSIAIENFRILKTAKNLSDSHILEGILIEEIKPDLNAKVENLSIFA